jgi:hypothetical protein
MEGIVERRAWKECKERDPRRIGRDGNVEGIVERRA